mgnify:FL=1|tara:strand:- start:23027 stop:24877 length:1851 start_codon:yes stop_codon:yes gene_type:complete
MIGPLLTAVAAGLDTLRKTLVEGISAGNSVDEALRALGTSFEQQSVPLTESMKNLHGSLADRLVPAVLTMNAGLQGNSQGIRQLINQQKLTGTQYAATAKSFAQLEALGGLQRVSTNALAINMIELGGQFEVTTDVLVQAVQGLSNNLVDMDLQGMDAHIIEAVVATQAKIPPALQGQFNKTMDLLFGTSMESFQSRITLGLGNFQTLMKHSGSTANAMRILEESVMEGGDRFRQVAGSVADFGIATAGAMFGAAKSFVPLAEALEEGGRVQNEAVQDFAASLKVIMKDVFVPLQVMFMEKLTPIIIRFAGEFKKISEVAMPKFAHFLGQGIEKLIEFGTHIPQYVETIGNAAHGLFLAIKNMAWTQLWEDIKTVSTSIWTNTKLTFLAGQAELVSIWAGMKEDYAALKLWIHDITSILEDIPFTEANQIHLELTEKLSEATNVAMRSQDKAADAALKLKESLAAAALTGSDVDKAFKGIATAHKSFELDAGAGSLGTFIKTGLDPFVPILTGIEANTAKTAAKLPENAETTAPTSMAFFQSTLSQAVGTIVGITGSERLERAAERQVELLLEIVSDDRATKANEATAKELIEMNSRGSELFDSNVEREVMIQAFE